MLESLQPVRIQSPKLELEKNLLVYNGKMPFYVRTYNQSLCSNVATTPIQSDAHKYLNYLHHTKKRKLNFKKTQNKLVQENHRANLTIF